MNSDVIIGNNTVISSGFLLFNPSGTTYTIWGPKPNTPWTGFMDNYIQYSATFTKP